MTTFVGLLIWILTKLFEVSTGITRLTETTRFSAESYQQTAGFSKAVAVITVQVEAAKAQARADYERLEKRLEDNRRGRDSGQMAVGS